MIAVLAMILGTAALAPRETAAATCAGQSHTLQLSDGAVSPGSGTADVRFRFTVRYADSGGCTPDRIVVTIVGLGDFGLTRLSGDLKAGATFGRTMRLPAGRWRYGFEATSGSGVGRRTVKLEAVDPTVVKVVAPTPKPTAVPTAEPTAGLTPQPTTLPTAKATVSPRPGVTPGDSPPAAASPTRTSSAAGAARSGGGPGGPPASDSRWPATSIDPGFLPRPVLALAVSSLGTLVGLCLFGILGGRMLRPSSRSEVGRTSWAGRDDRVGLPGSWR